MLPWK